jgi:hypothetical protein
MFIKTEADPNIIIKQEENTEGKRKIINLWISKS